jgi:membrane protein DedA with SNARE-associated domain
LGFHRLSPARLVAHHQLQALLENYGYLGVFIGALLEGETILIMAGFAAHRGLLHLPWVMALAAAGGFLGDQIFFALGRYRGQETIRRFPSIQRQALRVQDLIVRHSTWLIIGVRFMYGLRVAGPVLIGMSGVSHLRFMVLNAIGALIWAAVIAGLGYAFGQAIELFLHDVRRYEFVLLLVIAAVGAVFWMLRRARRPAP